MNTARVHARTYRTQVRALNARGTCRCAAATSGNRHTACACDRCRCTRCRCRARHRAVVARLRGRVVCTPLRRQLQESGRMGRRQTQRTRTHRINVDRRDADRGHADDEHELDRVVHHLMRVLACVCARAYKAVTRTTHTTSTKRTVERVNAHLDVSTSRIQYA
jgi:hypothetical protein